MNARLISTKTRSVIYYHPKPPMRRSTILRKAELPDPSLLGLGLFIVDGHYSAGANRRDLWAGGPAPIFSPVLWQSSFW